MRQARTILSWHGRKVAQIFEQVSKIIQIDVKNIARHVFDVRNIARHIIVEKNCAKSCITFLPLRRLF